MAREDLHVRFLAALELGVKIAEVSRQSGIGYESLRAFRSTKSLGVENQKKLEKWLDGSARLAASPHKAIDPREGGGRGRGDGDSTS